MATAVPPPPSASLQTVVASLLARAHHAVDRRRAGAPVICEMAVTYERHDGGCLTLPCLNVFRLRDGQIADYRIYMDINPVLAS